MIKITDGGKYAQCISCLDSENDVKALIIGKEDNICSSFGLCSKCREDLINKLINVMERSEDAKDSD